MHVTLSCSGLALVYWAALLLILPLNWIVAFTIAALFHELCHFLAVQLTGNAVYAVFIGHNGAVMETSPLASWQELLCALAGPAGSFLLFFCWRWFPRIALCAGVQGIFNMIPVYPLDGGRAYRILLQLWFPRHATAICHFTENLIFFLLFSLGVWLCFGLKLGFFPVFLPLLLLSRPWLEKLLANRRN